MIGYDIGYGKPPQRSRYKPGISGNPQGRPRRKSLSLAEIIERVLGTPVTFREMGREKSATRDELCLKMIIEGALKGNVVAAGLVLKIRAHARQYGNAAVDRIEIRNWLPDHPGQTAGQKARDAAQQEASVDTIEWWKDPTATQISVERAG
jgi:Family of unknown function (DUF5681)